MQLKVASNSIQMDVVAPIEIDSIIPNLGSAHGGTLITIKGKNFKNSDFYSNVSAFSCRFRQSVSSQNNL